MSDSHSWIIRFRDPSPRFPIDQLCPKPQEANEPSDPSPSLLEGYQLSNPPEFVAPMGYDDV